MDSSCPQPCLCDSIPPAIGPDFLFCREILYFPHLSTNVLSLALPGQGCFYLFIIVCTGILIFHLCWPFWKVIYGVGLLFLIRPCRGWNSNLFLYLWAWDTEFWKYRKLYAYVCLLVYTMNMRKHGIYEGVHYCHGSEKHLHTPRTLCYLGTLWYSLPGPIFLRPGTELEDVSSVSG